MLGPKLLKLLARILAAEEEQGKLGEQRKLGEKELMALPASRYKPPKLFVEKIEKFALRLLATTCFNSLFKLLDLSMGLLTMLPQLPQLPPLLQLPPLSSMTGLLVLVFFLFFSETETLAQNALPPDIWQLNEQVEFPDWSQTSFSDLAPVQKGGSISDEFNNPVGYDLSRTWQAGDTPDEIFKLGDLTDTLGAEKFSLRQISDLTGLDRNHITLSDFPLLANQSLEQLSKTIPFLGEAKIASVAPIDRLFTQVGQELIEDQLGWEIVSRQLGWDLRDLRNRQVGQVVDSIPRLKNLLFSRIDLKNVLDSGITLQEFRSLRMGQLVNMVPELSDLFSDKIGLGDFSGLGWHLIEQQLGWDLRTLRSLPLAEVVESIPELGDLLLNQIDLESFVITDIPNIDTIPIQNLTDWQSALFSEIPGLSDIALGQMPNPLAFFGGLVARIDMAYGPAEQERNNTISGSFEEGFRVPCSKECAYIELDDLEDEGRKAQSPFEGKQWISGKYQEVEGGYGLLKYLPSPEGYTPGFEPTGRHPYGDMFKVVIWEPDETKDEISTRLFFRICNSLGCTPYNVFSIPFLTYKINDNIFMGLLDEQGGVTSETSSASSEEKAAAAAGMNVRVPGGFSVPGGSGSASSPCTGAVTAGISLNTLGEAISSIESRGSGGDSAIGVYVCADGGKNCGRAIGKHQTMSYHPAMVEEVSQVPGGEAWLNKLNSGYTPTKAELMQFYPPQAQERAFFGEMSELIKRAMTQIDPTTGQPFRGERLLERTTQMWFGGIGAPIDGDESDALGRLSLYDYGVQASDYYNSRGGAPSASCAAIAQGLGNAKGNYIHPASGYPVTSEFGPRPSPCSGCSSNHRGIDIGTPRGTPIKAADGGTVVYAGSAGGYGNVIIIDHGGGRQTRYAHLDSLSVTVGSKVSQGQGIGAAGSTGVGTGAHLHFEIREGAVAGQPFSGTAVNPRQFIQF